MFRNSKMKTFVMESLSQGVSLIALDPKVVIAPINSNYFYYGDPSQTAKIQFSC